MIDLLKFAILYYSENQTHKEIWLQQAWEKSKVSEIQIFSG